VALVVGADTTPKGFLAPTSGERKDDPDWLRFRLLGATNPTYFAFYARRRMEVFGATDADFAQVKVKNARHGLENPYARYRKEVTVDEVLESPMVADPLRLLEICATSDGAAAVVLSSMEYARSRGADKPVRVAAVSTVTPRYPNTVIEMPNFSTDSCAVAAEPELTFRDSIAAKAYEEAGLGPEDLSLAEVYDLSSALELDWYENIGLCKAGEAERLLRDGDTTIGGRIPVNPSGGLACFGEAVPAQAIAQVCEVTWQLRGQAEGRQVDDAKVGLTVNQGLFGHGSSVILTK
jgi:acetyl-CoA acetyltransferase